MGNYVITIARGFGSGGKYIGKRLSEELHIPCYERQLLSLASKQSGIDESEFVEVDEKLRGSYLKNLLSKIPYSNLLEPQDKEFVSDINLFNIQAEVIGELARTESCIIIGKCADYILRERRNVISLYIEAEREDCVRSIMEKMYVSEERANTLIRKTDKYRANYYKYYTSGNDWRNPINYDMTLNTSKIGRERCVEVIKDYIKLKFQ
ncbi:MAG: cytidylate kinase-like family protein [bacterium]|nr:cytidylate kinase-like family protein [bacterium]